MRRCRYIPPPADRDKHAPPSPPFPCTPHSRRYRLSIVEYARVSMSVPVGFCRVTAPHRRPFRCALGPFRCTSGTDRRGSGPLHHRERCAGSPAPATAARDWTPPREGIRPYPLPTCASSPKSRSGVSNFVHSTRPGTARPTANRHPRHPLQPPPGQVPHPSLTPYVNRGEPPGFLANPPRSACGIVRCVCGIAGSGPGLFGRGSPI